MSKQMHKYFKKSRSIFIVFMKLPKPYYPRLEDSWQMHIVNVNDGCQTNLMWIFHCLQVYFKTWRTWIAMTTLACPTSSKSSATCFRIHCLLSKWKRITGCFGSSRAVLIDGRLVYPTQKNVLTYFIKSQTRQHLCHSTFWRRSF